MEFFGLLLLAVFVLLVILPIVALAKAAAARRAVDELSQRLNRLERLAWPAPGKAESAAPAAETPAPAATSVPNPPPVSRPLVIQPAPARPEPAPPKRAAADAIIPASARPLPEAAKLAEPAPGAEPRVQPEPELNSTGSLEEFMGAKLFAWIGGLALFFGIALFVKYSFDHNLISPAMRVAIGFAAGAGLIGSGLMMKRKENAVTAQTLCATGVVVLYAVTFACRSYYHFPLFSLPVTFILMAIITAGAFLLAIGMDAQVIAVLGIAGGFLTPFLLSTGADYPLPLFTYIGFLDAGLLALAFRRNWKALPMLGAIGTILTEWAWTSAFFEPGTYFLGNRILIPMAVYAAFQALFLGASALSRKRGDGLRLASESTLALGVVAFIAAFYFLGFPSIAHRPLLLCSYLFITDLGLIALTLFEKNFRLIRNLAGIAAFTFLTAWNQSSLTNSLLVPGLICYFLFALFHSAIPIILRRFEKTAPSIWSHLFPALSLFLAILNVAHFQITSLILWPFVLLLDLLSLFVALATASLLPVIAMIVLTFVVFTFSVTWINDSLIGLPTDLFLIGAFSLFFVTATAWVARRLAAGNSQPAQLLGSPLEPANMAVQLPALSAALPFLLIIQVMLRLCLHSPTPVFCLTLLLAAMLLTIARFFSIEGLPLTALFATLMVEYTWDSIPVDHSSHALWLVWFIGFYALFTIYPFLFRNKFASAKTPWITSALAGPAHFYLIRQLAENLYPHPQPGVLPAIFSIPALAALYYIATHHAATNPARQTQLAIYGGVAFSFITLIFPLQLKHEWITISWALEGTALCWLFRRVPHPGLRLAGIALLVTSFVRIGLNPAILSYYTGANYPIFNWYLYAFTVVSLALFAAARFLAPPRNVAAGLNAPPFLYGMGTILLFILLNVEIADYFAAPGSDVLTFEFSGNFARDMTYSITWALFALALLIIGIRWRNSAVRFSSFGLLSLTLIKLFFHDLSELDQLYRIAAFISVAVIAIVTSFLYQRFVGSETTSPDSSRIL